MPNGWVVCSLSTIANIFNGDSINEQEKHQKYFGRTEGYNYIGTKDVNYDHSINYENGIKIPYITNLKIAHKGAPLLCIEGGNAGKKIGKLNEDVCFGNKLCAFENYGINSQYLFYFLQSSDFIKIFRQNTQGIIGGVSINTIKALPFRLPPLNEQERIAKNVDLLLSQIDIIEQNQTGIETLYDELKKRTLDLAIQGKLVPQDENDEPASVLLEKIRAEKKAKLGKKYVDSYIYKGDDNCYYEKVGNHEPVLLDNLPFEIPDLWCWARLGNAVSINPRNSIDDETLISFVEMKSLKDGFNNEFTYELRYWREVKSGFTHFQNNDVSFAKITPCFQNRKSCVFHHLKNSYGAGTTELHILRVYPNTILSEYLLWFVKSPYFIEYGKKNFSGTAGQQRFGTNEMKNTFVPIPPYREQIRIVAQINSILQIFEKGEA